MLALVFSLGWCASSAHADGGTLLLWDKSGVYQVAVFTTALQAGPVDISVLVQDANGAMDAEATVVARLISNSERFVEPATFALATNKLYRAAHFELAAGRWDLDVTVTGVRGTTTVRGELEVGAAVTPALGMWLWFAWPALAVLLFAIHQVRARRAAIPH